MSHKSKFVAALVGLLVMTIVAGHQLSLFVMFKDPADQGGRIHLWLAVAASITACVAGGLMLYFFLLDDKNRQFNLSKTSTGSPLIAIRDHPLLNSPSSLAFDPIRWALANPWLSAGQADDRTPMDGSVADNGRTPSEQRAFARQSHQLEFKKWSQDRHD